MKDLITTLLIIPRNTIIYILSDLKIWGHQLIQGIANSSDRFSVSKEAVRTETLWNTQTKTSLGGHSPVHCILCNLVIQGYLVPSLFLFLL